MQQRFLLQILLLAQHVSGTTMPIIRSSRVLYGGCCLWYLVLWFSSCWSGVEPSAPHQTNNLKTTITSNKICNKNRCCIQLAFFSTYVLQFVQTKNMKHSLDNGGFSVTDNTVACKFSTSWENENNTKLRAPS